MSAIDYQKELVSLQARIILTKMRTPQNEKASEIIEAIEAMVNKLSTNLDFSDPTEYKPGIYDLVKATDAICEAFEKKNIKLKGEEA